MDKKVKVEDDGKQAEINCCGLFAKHLIKKKSNIYKWAAWTALILSCTAVFLDLMLMWYIYPMEVQEVHHYAQNHLGATDAGEDITSATAIANKTDNRATNEDTQDNVTRITAAVQQALKQHEPSPPTDVTSAPESSIRILKDHTVGQKINRNAEFRLETTGAVNDSTRFAAIANKTDNRTIPLKHPVEYVIISHTATDPCTTQAECTRTVRYLQAFHVEGKKWMDSAYNFMVAGDGQAYEGRGWDVVGAHTAAGFNGISVGISFVGTFSDVVPPPVQIRACKLLIEEGVTLGKISSNYKLIADRQVSQSENPGQMLFEELKTWEHWTADVLSPFPADF